MHSLERGESCPRHSTQPFIRERLGVF